MTGIGLYNDIDSFIRYFDYCWIWKCDLFSVSSFVGRCETAKTFLDMMDMDMRKLNVQ